MWCAMLATKVAFPVTVLFLVSLASEARYHARLSRVLQSSDGRSSFRAREHREKQDWHFKQCHFVDVWKEHLGYVSVLAFLDPTWHYSFRQAVMLELLSSRLRKSGFPDVRFFVISPFSDSRENERSENDLEIEVWQEIGAKYEIENFVDDVHRGNRSEITILQDDPQSRMWERFRASREQAIIIDRCGKLTYHVIVPWSILFFPYVKAAILPTYKEDPCGGCDPAVYRAPNHEDYVVKLTKGTKEEVNPIHRYDSDTKFELIWTTENLDNATLHHEESSEEKCETSTAFSIPFEEITNTDRPNLLTESPTESTTYQHDNYATESQFNKNLEPSLVAEDAQNQEEPNSRGGGTIPIGTVAIFEPQQDVLPPEQKESHPPVNNSLTPANEDMKNSTLLFDEVATGVTESDLTSADKEVTTSDFADEIRDNTTPENTENFAFLPLRIIMYAPHVHKNSKKTKKYKHLILKIGDLDFHEHLDSGDAPSPTDSSPAANSHVTSSEEYDWETTEEDANEKNANQMYTFDRNESPGLYGEVADYWKSYEDNDVTDRNETFNDYNNSTTNYNEEHRSNVSDHTASFSKPKESYSITEDPNVGDSTDPENIVGSNTIESSKSINTNNQLDKEEEMRYELIEHYNKLLSWVDYRLNK